MKQAQMEVSEETNMSWHGFLPKGAVRQESWMRLSGEGGHFGALKGASLMDGFERSTFTPYFVVSLIAPKDLFIF